MSCKLIFVKFENVSGGGVGYYDLADNDGRIIFTDIHTTQLEAGMTFSIGLEQEQVRLTNFRLSGAENPCGH